MSNLVEENKNFMHVQESKITKTGKNDSDGCLYIIVFVGLIKMLLFGGIWLHSIIKYGSSANAGKHILSDMEAVINIFLSILEWGFFAIMVGCVLYFIIGEICSKFR